MHIKRIDCKVEVSDALQPAFPERRINSSPRIEPALEQGNTVNGKTSEPLVGPRCHDAQGPVQALAPLDPSQGEVG